MKRVFITLILIIVLIFPLFYFYPSKNNIIGNKHYEISNHTNTNTINVTIIPSKYDLNYKSYNVNELLLNEFDMKFYLKNIFIDDFQRIVIKFICETKWHFINGNYLSVSEIIKEGNQLSYSNAPLYFKITDENNQKIQYLQYGIGSNDDSVEIILNKDIFKSSKSINIEINGLNIINYTRKSLF